jgi:O-antigen/teichoic acid export membrane protein
MAGDERSTEAPGAQRAPLRGAVAWSLGGKTVEMVTLVLLATVVPRRLGPSDYGEFSVALTVVTIGSLAMTLGGPTLMARFVPAAAPDQRVAVARALGARLARGRALQVALLLPVAAAFVVWDDEAFRPEAVGVVVLALALNVATSLALQVTLGLGRAGPWSTRFPLQNAVLVAGVLLLYPAHGVGGTIAAILVSALAGAAFAAVAVLPHVRGPQPKAEVPAGAIRFGAYQAAGAALVQLTQRGGVLAVAILAGSAVQTGYTALAVGIALGATYAILQAFTVSLPHLAGDDQDRPAEAVLRRLATGLALVLLPACAVVALLLDPLVAAVFGDEFEDAAATFGPALAVVLLAPLSALLVQTSALRLRAHVSLAAGIASAVAFVVAALVLVPGLEAVGGTAATLAGVAAGAVVALRLLPGAAGGRLAALSFTGAGIVLVLAAVAT